MALRSSLLLANVRYDRLYSGAQLCPSSASPQLAIDASFRHRNGRAQGASIIQSVQRTSPNYKGRTIDVHDLVSISRRCTLDVPLAVVCAFARDGKRCFFHGTEEEWRRKVDHGTPEEKQLMLCGNCYSSGTIRFPLAPQLAEGIGAHLICLRSQLDGFCGTTVVHDQDSHTGKLFRSYFRSILECYDRSHIQVSTISLV